MTDTTDTAALREFLMEQIDHADSYGGKVWLCAEDARLAMSSLDQLEAERQRADDNSAECQRQASKVGRIKHELNKAEAELAALKGDQVPVATGTTEKCSPDVYAKGISACLVDIPKEKAEVICRGISAASGVAVDWHYVGGRVHIKAMRVTAPQKPVVPMALFDGYQPHIVRELQAAFKMAIEAAGCIVKDGE